MPNKAHTISAEQADRLFWLGRYVERVHTTLKLFNNALDEMIDHESAYYIEFCRRLSIPSDIYRDADDFGIRYLFAADNPDSIYSNLSRAYDNAIVLRNFITSESLSYIQMGLDLLEKADREQSAFLEVQQVIDWVLAFWGSVDENVVDAGRRDLLKVGRYVERIDLAIRLDLPYEVVERVIPRLRNRGGRVQGLLNMRNVDAFLDAVSTKESYEARKADALILINSLHI